MRKLGLCIKRVNKDESGAALAEYAVLLIIVAVVGVGGVTLLGTNLNAAFNGMASWVATNVTGALKT